MKTLKITLFILLFSGIVVFALPYTLADSHLYEISKTWTLSNRNEVEMNEFSLDIKKSPMVDSVYQESFGTYFTFKDCSGSVIDNGSSYIVSISHVKPKAEAIVTMKDVVSTGKIGYNQDLSHYSGDYSSFPQYSLFTSPSNKIESDSPEIILKAKRIVGNESNYYRKAKKIFDYVNLNMTYDTEFGNKGALSALHNLKGVCEDFSDLFIALCRAVGIPARAPVGFRLYNMDNAETDSIVKSAPHAWAEFYLPNYGWIICEPTVTFTENGKRVVANDYFAKDSRGEHIVQQYGQLGSFSYKYSLSGKITSTPNITCSTMVRKIASVPNEQLGKVGDIDAALDDGAVSGHFRYSGLAKVNGIFVYDGSSLKFLKSISIACNGDDEMSMFALDGLPYARNYLIVIRPMNNCSFGTEKWIMLGDQNCSGKAFPDGKLNSSENPSNDSALASIPEVNVLNNGALYDSLTWVVIWRNNCSGILNYQAELLDETSKRVVYRKNLRRNKDDFFSQIRIGKLDQCKKFKLTISANFKGKSLVLAQTTSSTFEKVSAKIHVSSISRNNATLLIDWTKYFKQLKRYDVVVTEIKTMKMIKRMMFSNFGKVGTQKIPIYGLKRNSSYIISLKPYYDTESKNLLSARFKTLN